MRFSHVCIAVCLSSATAFVPLSQPKRTFIPSTDFSPRSTAFYGKKNKHEEIITMKLIDETVKQAAKLEGGAEILEVKPAAKLEVSAEILEVSSLVEEQGEEKEIDPQLLIDEERMGKVIDMVQAA
jgi:hypothetical protein